MTEYIPDPIEAGEDRAERAYERMHENVPDGFYRCGCGKVVPESEENFMSSDPFSIPCCNDCAIERER